jgi:serine/threonine protein kinase
MEAVQTLGRYEIRGTLGRGAMGVVHDGFDPVIGRRVAIKTVRLPDQADAEAQEEVARFRRESQAAGRLTHPNIVSVYDFGETGDVAFIVMEFVDGPTLKALLDKQERFALPAIQRIMDDLLAGLRFSHERGIVHRDIKPANVMLTSEGQAKIADFGIARIENSSMTQVGTVLGTPSYMSPEQFMGQVVDARTDIYSAGVLLYQLLTGDRPFDGGFSTIMHKALHTDPPWPSEVTVTAPAALDAVVRRAMAKRPEERFASAAEFAAAIRAAMVPGGTSTEATQEATVVLRRPVEVAPPITPAPSPKPTAPARVRSRTLLPIAAGIGIIGLAGVGAGAWFLRTPTPAPVAEVTPEPLPQPPFARGGAVETEPAPSSPTSPAGVTGKQAAPSQASPAPAAPTPPAPAPEPTPPESALIAPARAPAPSAPAPASAEILRQALATASCSAMSAQIPDDGPVVVSGIAGGRSVGALRERIAALVRPRVLDWQVTSVGAVFCGALGAVHATGLDASPPTLILAGNRTALHDGERIQPVVTMPAFGGELRVDYIVHDGSLVHLYPTVADPAQHAVAVPARTLAPNERLTLGIGSDGKPIWEVGPPYGTDIILAVASSVPLLTQPPPENAVDSGTAYLRQLQAAIEAARTKGAKVSSSLLPVQTLPK